MGHNHYSKLKPIQFDFNRQNLWILPKVLTAVEIVYLDLNSGPYCHTPHYVALCYFEQEGPGLNGALKAIGQVIRFLNHIAF